jgi:hypothetical protein
MILFFRPSTIFFFFLSFSITYAARWPLIKTAVVRDGNMVTFSSKKSVLISRKRLKKNIFIGQSHYLFNNDKHIKKWHELAEYAADGVKAALYNDQKPIVIRVLLACCDKQSSVQWNFSAQTGFVVHAAKDKHFNNRMAMSVKIEIKNGQLICNGKRVNGTIQITPILDHALLNGVAYDGNFFIMPDKGKFLCINGVELEDYIAAVLKTESWPGWPLEVNKVFAIASRSYVVYQALQARHSKRPFHVKNSNVHQTYKGRHDVVMLKEAVAQTRGIVLGFEGKPILAMFDCCCGGVIPAHIADFDFKKAPYLARPYACNNCKTSSLYSWQASYEHALFEALIKKQINEKKLFDICITKKDKAGLVI